MNLFLLKINTINAQNCSWVENNMCPQEKPTISKVNRCNTRTIFGLCCCEEATKEKIIKPKYIIISSLFIILGGITLFSFVLKNNEKMSNND